MIDEERGLALPGDPHRVWLRRGRAAPAIPASGQGRRFVGWCIVPIILVCPLLIPSANVGLRAASAFASGDITFKMVDYFRHWGNVERSRVLREYYRFLIPFPVFSAVYPDHKRRLLRPESPRPQVLRLSLGSSVVPSPSWR